MVLRWILVTAVLGSFFFQAQLASAAARDEVIDYCKRAAEVITNQGIKAGIQQIGDRNGPFIWNDGVNYVFLMDMKGRMLAHPYKPKLTKMEHVLDYADVDGKKFFVDFIEKAERGRGWVKYKWPLPTTEEIKPKSTYIYRIPGTDYFVGSGFYVLKAGVYK
jgi:preprotein translocase subunit YajC